MKLSLIMIAKNEKENLERLYPLVKDYIDEWIVVVPPGDKVIPFLVDKATVIKQDFTQPIETKIRSKIEDYGLKVNSDYRLFNFAAARNKSLEAATGDYILWLDADDEPIGMDNIKSYIAQNPDIDEFSAIYDYYQDEEGNSISDHVRERIIKNNGKWEWIGAELGLIHETILPKGAYEPTRLDIDDNIFRVKHLSDHVDESSMRNHIALLYEYIKTKGKDPRTTYYLGIEFFNRKMYDYCIKILLEYVKVGGSQEDRFNAWLKIGEAYHMLKDPKSGRNAFLKAEEEMPQRPEPYLGLGESYFEEENWSKCIEFTLTGLQKRLPQTKQALDLTRYTFRPSGYIAQAYLQLGRPKDAYEWFGRAMKSNPKHPWVKEYVSLFKDAKDLDDYVKSFVKLGQISQRLYPKTLSRLAEVIPDELKDQDLLMDFKWRYSKPSIWPSNSVVIFCSSAYEDWGPESLQSGCGGSEEAVIQVSKQLVKLGWEVTVYNNCTTERTVDGVKWVRFERFNPRDIFNILVSWRNNIYLDPKVAKKKYIDLHDVPDGRFYQEDDLKDIKILVKSKFHRTVLPHLSDERFVIIPNGVDLEQFKNPKKTKNNMVWTSSYDRGLEHLLKMWPDVLKEVPNATLDVYYGFELHEARNGTTGDALKWKTYMMELLDQPGVTDHGRVGTEEVAEAYKKADVFAYPTDFPEIDCISLTKAMAARCVPITTDYAVMKERNQGIMVISADYDNFKKVLIQLLKDDKKKEQFRKELDVSQYSWENIAQRWDEEFKS